MPNDCRNFVTITGNPETIKLLVEKKLDFESFIPTPENCTDPIEWRSRVFNSITFPSDFNSNRPFEPIDLKSLWRSDNWGTKWCPYNYQEKLIGARGMRVAFDTAWNPPSAFFEKLLSLFPDLWIKCEWHEEGGYAGVWVGRKNDIQELTWVDMCLEEEDFVFRKKNS